MTRTILYRSFLGRLWRSTYLRDSLTLVSSNVIAQSILFVTIPILTRLYTPENFGEFEVFYSLVSILSILLNGRYDLAIMLPKSEQKGRELLVGAMGLVAMLTLITVGVLAIFGKTILAILDIKLSFFWLVIIGPVAGIVALRSVLQYWHARQKDFRILAQNRIMLSTLTVTSQGMVYFSPALVGIMLICGRIVAEITTTFSLFRHTLKNFSGYRLHLRNEVAAIKEYRHFPLYLLWGGLLNSLTHDLPVLILAAHYSPKMVGLFALARRVITTPLTLASDQISTVFYQRVMVEVNAEGKARQIVIKTFFLLAGISVVAFALIYIAAPLLSTILGSDWQNINDIIIPLIPLAAARFAIAPLAKTFSALERQKEALLWQISFIISGLGILWLVSTHSDFISTLWAYSITVAIGYGIMLLLCLYMDKREHNPSELN